MKAVVFDGVLRYERDYPIPEVKPGWARIAVEAAGICKTDLEITKGYLGFQGVLGHEFVGVVESCADSSWLGKRVVGEINCACGHCSWCEQGLGRHCPQRTTLGIDRLNGCMAEYCVLPTANLYPVAPDLAVERAVLVEPLAAACEILEQLAVSGTERIVVLGDGRLGILCAWVLATVAADVTLVGRHPEKLALAAWRGLKTVLSGDGPLAGADIVVEATGSGAGLNQALALCRPRGTVVLKSTVASPGELDLAPLVINEITLLGSRCGRFTDALAMLAESPDMPLARLITHRYPLDQAEAAFAQAASGQALKVLLEIPSSTTSWQVELKRLEAAIARLAAEMDDHRGASVTRPEEWRINPALELLTLSWRGLPAWRQAAGDSSPPEPGQELVLIWATGGQIHCRTATDADLLALKISAEELTPEAVAAAEEVPIGRVDAILDRAAKQGLLLAPPTLLRRDASMFPLPATTPPERRLVEVFTLQWHITQACDLNCRHCYDRSPRAAVSRQEGLALLAQLRRFCRQRGVRGQVSFSGGNPLLHPDFLLFYRETVDYGLSPAILGNPAEREKLAAICAIGKPVFYQVSLEGLAEHNDYIRGKGHFERVLAFLELLREFGIFSMVMLTLTRDNLDQVLPLAEILRHRADLFTFNRLAEVGQGAALASVTAADYQDFLADYLQAARDNPVIRLKDNLLNRLLYQGGEPLFGGCAGFGCGAAFNFVAALPDGEVHACRKFPSPIGDLRQHDLATIYDGKPAQDYRAGCHACRDCAIRPVCGGCLAVAYGSGREVFQEPDPCCPGPVSDQRSDTP
ncbi:MAG: thio(seleno)oxazole modification radical SAM maturase SbtM [Desulfurivibrio sp.]|nr:thio(seleno)oxazole modification radical SAM maturase SbtM [Desulfurivibrio sp.]